MPRYYSKTRASEWMEDWQSYPLVPEINVPEHRTIKTGLLDKDGNDIWRGPNPIGFGNWRA